MTFKKNQRRWRSLYFFLKGCFLHPKRQWLIIRDYFSFKKNLYKAQDQQIPILGEKNILIVNLANSIYSCKLEGMLAVACRKAGAKIRILTAKSSFWTRQYFKLFGFFDFISFDDIFLSQEEQDEASRVARQFLAKPYDFATVKQWRYDNAPIGVYAISTVARMLQYGMPDLTDQKVKTLFSKQLHHTISGYLKAKKLFKQSCPDVCLFNEINYSDYGPLFAAASERSIDIIQYVHALGDNALIFKRRQHGTEIMHPNSVDLKELDKLCQSPWDNTQEEALKSAFAYRYGGQSIIEGRDQKGTVHKKRFEVAQQTEICLDKKTAVIFSHVLWDANLFYGTDLFNDNQDWFLQTVQAACQNNAVNWIIKLHPANKWKFEKRGENSLNEIDVIKKHIGTLPDHVTLLMPETDINSYSLYSIVDWAVTIRGTIGIELPCFGIPVLTAGTGRYSGFGFTIDSETRESYLNKIATIQDIPELTKEQALRAKRHAYLIFNRRPWQMQGFCQQFKHDAKKEHPLKMNLHPTAQSTKAETPETNLMDFSRWVLRSPSVDYIGKEIVWDAIF